MLPSPHAQPLPRRTTAARTSPELLLTLASPFRAAPQPNRDHKQVSLDHLLLIPHLALAAGELLAGIPAGQCRSPPLISARDLFVILKLDFRVQNRKGA